MTVEYYSVWNVVVSLVWVVFDFASMSISDPLVMESVGFVLLTTTTTTTIVVVVVR